MQNNIIPRNLLKIFLHHKQLSNVVEFLNFIKKNKRNFHDFSDFCRKHNKNTSEPTHNAILFHGSKSVQKTLQPHTSIGSNGKRNKHSYVYATDDPNYAIFLAILDLQNGVASVNAGTNKTILSLNLDFINGPSKLRKGYVHIIDKKIFKKTGNREYISAHPVKTVYTIPVDPADLSVPIYVQTGP